MMMMSIFSYLSGQAMSAESRWTRHLEDGLASGLLKKGRLSPEWFKIEGATERGWTQTKSDESVKCSMRPQTKETVEEKCSDCFIVICLNPLPKLTGVWWAMFFSSVLEDWLYWEIVVRSSKKASLSVLVKAWPYQHRAFASVSYIITVFLKIGAFLSLDFVSLGSSGNKLFLR